MQRSKDKSKSLLDQILHTMDSGNIRQNFFMQVSELDTELSKAATKLTPERLQKLDKVNAKIIETLSDSFTQMAESAFQSLSPNDFDDFGNSASFKKINDLSLTMIEFIAQSILIEADQSKRNILLERYIQLTMQLHEKGDYFSAYNVFSALELPEINRLYTTDSELLGLSQASVDKLKVLQSLYRPYVDPRANLRKHIEMHIGPRFRHIDVIQKKFSELENKIESDETKAISDLRDEIKSLQKKNQNDEFTNEITEKQAKVDEIRRTHKQDKEAAVAYATKELALIKQSGFKTPAASPEIIAKFSPDLELYQQATLSAQVFPLKETIRKLEGAYYKIQNSPTLNADEKKTAFEKLAQDYKITDANDIPQRLVELRQQLQKIEAGVKVFQNIKTKLSQTALPRGTAIWKSPLLMQLEKSRNKAKNSIIPPMTTTAELNKVYAAFVNDLKLKSSINRELEDEAPHIQAQRLKWTDNVLQSILSQPTIKQRALTLEKWIFILNHMREEKAYLPMLTLYQALSHPSIGGLQKTFEGLSDDAKNELATVKKLAGGDTNLLIRSMPQGAPLNYSAIISPIDILSINTQILVEKSKTLESDETKVYKTKKSKKLRKLKTKPDWIPAAKEEKSTTPVLRNVEPVPAQITPELTANLQVSPQAVQSSPSDTLPVMSSSSIPDTAEPKPVAARQTDEAELNLGEFFETSEEKRTRLATLEEITHEWTLSKCESYLLAAAQSKIPADTLELARLKATYQDLLKEESEQLTAYTLHQTLKKSDPVENEKTAQTALTELANFIVNEILNEPHIDKRTLMVERYIHLMQRANANSDYLTVAAIYNALHDPNVKALQKTFAGVSDNASTLFKSSIDSQIEKAYGKNPLTGKDVLEMMPPVMDRGSVLSDKDKPLIKRLHETPKLSPADQKAKAQSLIEAEAKTAPSIISGEATKDILNVRGEEIKKLPIESILENRKTTDERINDLLLKMLNTAQLITQSLERISNNVDVLATFSESPKVALS